MLVGGSGCGSYGHRTGERGRGRVEGGGRELRHVPFQTPFRFLFGNVDYPGGDQATSSGHEEGRKFWSRAG